MSDDEGGTPAGTEDESSRAQARIREQAAQIRALKEQVKAAEARVAELEPVAARVEAAETAAAEAARKADTSVTLARAGVTDADAADLVLHRYGKLAEEDRPALADWLTDAAKADPLLAGVWGQPAAPPAEAAPSAPAAEQAAAPPTPPPQTGRPNAGAVTGRPAAPPPVSVRVPDVAELAKMTPQQRADMRRQIYGD